MRQTIISFKRYIKWCESTIDSQNSRDKHFFLVAKREVEEKPARCFNADEPLPLGTSRYPAFCLARTVNNMSFSRGHLSECFDEVSLVEGRDRSSDVGRLRCRSVRSVPTADSCSIGPTRVLPSAPPRHNFIVQVPTVYWLSTIRISRHDTF